MRGVHICGTQASAVGARARSWRTVESDEIFRIARTVKVRRPLGEAEVEIGQRCPASAGNQSSKPNRVASIQLKRINLLAGYQLLHRGGFRLKLDR